MAQRLTNPYSANRGNRPGEAPTAVVPNPPHMAYAVPDIPESTDPEYTDGYATQLDPDYESGTTPDAIRVGTAEPPFNDPNIRAYNERRTGDFHHRHSVEETDTGWKIKQNRVPPGQNPLWEQPRMPIRPTADNSPLNYAFRRPWHIPRFIAEAVHPEAVDHISMADHRRAYEIFGMRTQDRVGVNTHRLDPVPWDEGLFPPDQRKSVEPPNTPAQPGVRSFRLG